MFKLSFLIIMIHKSFAYSRKKVLLGLDDEAEWLQRQLGLRPVEHAPSLRERPRDDRALCLSPLDAICNDTSPTQRPPQLPIISHHEIPMRGRRGRKGAACTHRGMTGWKAVARRTCHGWRRTP
jgi:hypothetical protein